MANGHEKMVVGELENGDLSAYEGIEVIRPKWKDFEYNNPFFWFTFEMLFGRMMANHIEKKSIKIILEHATPEERKDWEDGINREKILAKYRRNFGKRALTELFELKTTLFNRSSPLMQHLCRRVANADALDDIYNVFGGFKINGERTWPEAAKPDILARVWIGWCANGQSVRNRYRMVQELYKQRQGGKTLSIACGSAQPLIHAIHDLRSEGRDGNTQLFLTDTEEAALECAKKKAQQAGVLDKIIFMCVPFTKLSEKLGGQKFDIIEACGILDYLPSQVAVELIKGAFYMLNEGGTVIFSNMSETYAAELLRKLSNWEVIYRTPEQLGRLIQIAGGKEIRVHVEPWGIHPVATATK